MAGVYAGVGSHIANAMSMNGRLGQLYWQRGLIERCQTPL